MDEAGRAVRAGDARVRVVRPQQPAGRRARVALPRARADGPDLRRAVAPGDGGRPRRVRRANKARDPLRVPLGGHAPRGRRARAADLRRRVPLPGRGVRDRRHRALEGADPGSRERTALRGHGLARGVPRRAGLHRRQAQLGLRGRERAPPLGLGARACITTAGGHRANRSAGRPHPVSEPARRVLARWGRRARRRCGHRADRAARRRLPDHGARDDVAGRADVRGRPRARGDRLPDAAPRPARPRAGDSLRRTGPRADAVLRKRVRSGRVLRRATRRRVRPAYASRDSRATRRRSTGSATTPASLPGTWPRRGSGRARAAGARAGPRAPVSPRRARPRARALGAEGVPRARGQL